MRSSNLEKILGRLEGLDATNLTILVQRLARERSLLETVFNTIQEGVLVIDDKGVVEYCNEAAQKLLGLQDKDIGSGLLWKLVPDFAQMIPAHLDSIKDEGTTVFREVELTYPDNRFLRVYLVPFLLADKEMTKYRYTLIISDITEDKISTEAYIESEKLSSILMLAAGVAHEIGNPLNSINIHLQLIQKELKGLSGKSATKVSQSVKICSDEVERLDHTIKHFLEAIRPTQPNKTSVNVLEVVEEVLRLVSKELENLDIVVELDIAQNVPTILADYNQLNQAFFNIIRNASEAMDSGGTVKITARWDDHYLYLYFADTGKGLEPHELGKVLDPYYTTKSTGHGLGMMIVQRIMRDHKGAIGIDSKPEVGTVVRLQFPLKNKRLKMLKSVD